MCCVVGLYCTGLCCARCVEMLCYVFCIGLYCTLLCDDMLDWFVLCSVIHGSVVL